MKTAEQAARAVADNTRENMPLVDKYLELARAQMRLTLEFAELAVQENFPGKATSVSLLASIQLGTTSPEKALAQLGAARQKSEHITLVLLDTKTATINIYGKPDVL